MAIFGLVARGGAIGADPVGEKSRGSVRPATAPSGPSVQVPGTLIDFPKDAQLPYDRVGLFIGIDRYPRIQPELDGCVNDARAMRAIFADRFGFKRTALLTDGKATREGILKVLESLIDQVRAGRSKLKPDDTITVLIYYAGHGSQVRDQKTPAEGKDEEDGRDETWVASDSSMRGDRDVRDDEIQVVYKELIRLGAQVMLISDSCHSGTIHRSAEFAKARMVYRADPGDGPPLYRFRNIPAQRGTAQAGESEGKTGIVGGKPLPGFVAYTACRETEKANEDRDDSGQPCGRFTRVLRRLLSEIGPDTTYETLHKRVLMEFQKNHCSAHQTPQFYSVAGKRGELFLKGGYPVPHGTIVPGSPADAKGGSTARVNMGFFQGVTQGSVFLFYANLDDLRADRNRLTAGEVQSVEAETCLVRLADKGPRLSDKAKARLDSVRMADLRVRVADDLPQPMKSMLAELDKNKQLRLAGPKDKYSLAIYHDAKDRAVRFYAPEALPDPEGTSGPAGPAKSQPRPLREFRYEDPAGGAELLSKHLLYLARIQRLMSLDRNDGHIQVTILTDGGAGKPVGDGDGGVPRLTSGRKFSISLKNTGPRAVYVTLFAFSSDRGTPPQSTPAGTPSKEGGMLGDLEILYPKAGDEVRKLDPGGDPLIISGFTATAEKDVERTAIKVLATENDVDFSPLEVPPDRGGQAVKKSIEVRTRSGGIRGSESDLFGLIKDVMHGGPRTRGVSREASRDMYWETAVIVFDVAKDRRP